MKTHNIISPELRQYQEIDYNNIVKAFESNKSVCYQAPTGSGKSVVIAKKITSSVISNRKVLFLSNRTHLQKQMKQRLKKLNVNVSTFSASNIEALKADVVCVTIQTAISDNNFNVLTGTLFDDVIIDECHRSVTKSYLDVIRQLSITNPLLLLLGVTATTNRFDMKPLSMIYTSMVSCSKSMSELVNDGYLAKYRVFTIPMSDLETAIESHGGDFVIESMSKYMRNSTIIKKCVEQYSKLASGRSTIIFCVDKKHTVQLQKAYADAGFPKSAIIDESVSESERNVIFAKFESGEIEIIFCIETLTEGLDLPNCNCVQLCRPTKSMILYLQMVGRALRPKEDDGDAYILDSALNVDRLGMPTSDIHWDLEGKRHKKSQKKGKVIVYKGMDGAIQLEQNEDMPWAEMVEVGFGELSQASDALIAMAEASNNRIYMEYYANFLDLCMHILNGSGVDMKDVELIEVDPEMIPKYGNHKEAKFLIKSLGVEIEMEVDRRNPVLIKVTNRNVGRSLDSSKIEDYVKLNKAHKIHGDIAWFINKDLKNIINNLMSIKIDEDQLQDVRELQRMKEDMEESNMIHDIEVALKRDGKVFFELTKRKNSNANLSAFNLEWYKQGEYGVFHKCIICLHSQYTVNSNNKVIFYNEYTEDYEFDGLVELYSTKVFKKDRFLGMLKEFNAVMLSDSSTLKFHEN